jgi:hypothetical protein
VVLATDGSELVRQVAGACSGFGKSFDKLQGGGITNWKTSNSGPDHTLLPGPTCLRLVQGVLWGRHAATRPLGRRAGTQHGRQKRSIQAVSAGGVKNRSDVSLEFNV